MTPIKATAIHSARGSLRALSRDAGIAIVIENASPKHAQPHQSEAAAGGCATSVALSSTHRTDLLTTDPSADYPPAFCGEISEPEPFVAAKSVARPREPASGLTRSVPASRSSVSTCTCRSARAPL